MTPFHTRSDWGARVPVCSSTNIRPEGDTVHYGGPSPWTGTIDRSSPAAFQATADHNRCASILRAWQAYHMDTRGWCDLAYSSAVCPHGHRYEGRGPGLRTGAQGTNDGNLRSYATVYIGGEGDPFPDAAKLAFLDEGDRFAGLRWGHRDWHPTGCPGSPIYAWKTAGFPRPTVAPPPPKPTPQPDEDIMPKPWIVHPISSQSYFLWRDDVLIYLPTTPDITSAEAAGAPVWHVSDALWATLSSRNVIVTGPPAPAVPV